LDLDSIRVLYQAATKPCLELAALIGRRNAAIAGSLIA
jgi:hypothetical protein